MNKTILLCLALTCLLSLVGCEQKIDTWSGQNVAYINMEVDSTVVSFAYLDEDVDTVSVEIAVMGDVEEGVSRYVEVKLVEKNAMVGEDYETLAERYEVPSGTTSCVVPVVVKRPNDESDKEVILELVENDDFYLYYQDDVLTSGSAVVYSKTTHRILFNNEMKEAPNTWNEYYFGTFSPLKFETICTVMEIPRTSFLSTSYMGFGRISYIANYMKAYLDEHPIMDGDKEMRMGDFLYQ